MRKKTIRHVFTGKSEYYVYDLDEDAFGKRKRLYAKTEVELKEKIKEAEAERQLKLSFEKPRSEKLKDYVVYYFKNAVGNVSAKTLKHLIFLAENAIYGSDVDKDISLISAEELQDFLQRANEKYPRETAREIFEILHKAFDLARESDIAVQDFSTVQLPEQRPPKSVVEYIMSPEELDSLVQFCIQDRCTRYGKSELIILFALFTGLMMSDIQKITVADLSLDEKLVHLKKRTGYKQFFLTDECVNWLRDMQKIGFIGKEVDGESAQNEEEGDGQVYQDILLSPANSKRSVEGSPLLFGGSRTAMPTQQSIQCTLAAITKRCGLPRGITGKTVRKAVIVKELARGTSAEFLKEQYGYKNTEVILSVLDEYSVRRTLF
jgi:integrase/uncharacterized protein (DUF433 family)